MRVILCGTEYRLRRPAARADAAELLADFAQPVANLRGAAGVGQHRDRFARDSVRREIVLNQLRHDLRPAIRFTMPNVSTVSSRRPSVYVSGDTR